ncbi:hypothetical protein OCU04_008880 [Sclerotinia nivalis]|uniref:Uncharacterized protein n=1 Tax=Sclerotinia nivalis TaxID=352851 RepID=A0A9X0AGG1_9HELO|nr:hypothetical protein OCU04_008880 [Sclerotinia nivalis]
MENLEPSTSQLAEAVYRLRDITDSLDSNEEFAIDASGNIIRRGGGKAKKTKKNDDMDPQSKASFVVCSMYHITVDYFQQVQLEKRIETYLASSFPQLRYLFIDNYMITEFETGRLFLCSLYVQVGKKIAKQFKVDLDDSNSVNFKKMMDEVYKWCSSEDSVTCIYERLKSHQATVLHAMSEYMKTPFATGASPAPHTQDRNTDVAIDEITDLLDKFSMNHLRTRVGGIEMYAIFYGFGLYGKESLIQNNKNKASIVNVSSIEVVKGVFVNNIGYRGGSILDVNAATQLKEFARLQRRLSKKSKSIG